MVHMRMMAVQPSLGESAPVHNAVKDWKRVIDKFHMPCVLVFDSYYTSAESIRILTASDQASEGSGTSQSKTVCRFIGSVRPNRYSLTDAFSGLVTTPGHWEGLYNETSGLLLVHYYDRDDRVGRKYVLSNAHVRKMKTPPKAQIPTYHDYKARFAGADIFLGHQHNFVMSCVLQNVFNAFVHTNRLPSTSFSFSEHCLLLADEIYYYATNLTT